MPKSKVRKKTAYTPPTDKKAAAKVHAQGPTHPIYLVVMFGLMLVGLAWIVVDYLAREHISLLFELGNWNFLIGFALMITGLLMTMRWR